MERLPSRHVHVFPLFGAVYKWAEEDGTPLRGAAGVGEEAATMGKSVIKIGGRSMAGVRSDG